MVEAFSFRHYLVEDNLMILLEVMPPLTCVRDLHPPKEIVEELKRGIAPDTISGRRKLENNSNNVSTETI